MMPQLSHHSTARNSVVDIVDLSGNMMQQISSTQKEKGGKKKQKLRDIDPPSCFPHAGIVVKKKKKILEEARALGLVGTDTTTPLTGRSVLRGSQDFYEFFFHVVTYFEGFCFCSAPDKESGPASWDFSPRASLNQTLKEVKITGLILTVCPSREYPILLLLRFPLYVLYSSRQQAIVENMLF
jgi:hypothetical protein